MNDQLKTVVCLKAYGDLVIALSVIRSLRTCEYTRVKFLIGEHLVDLWNALNVDYELEILSHGAADIPPIYDLRETGGLKGFQSLILIAGKMYARRAQNEVLIFPFFGWRERLFSLGSDVASVKPINNIYIDYFLMLKGRFHFENEQFLFQGKGRHIAIFPHGRKSTKTLPSKLLERIAKLTLECGLIPTVYILQGQEIVECTHGRVEKVERSFNKMLDIINRSVGTVSADSLPAHLSEFMRRPVFVAAGNAGSRYWLPPHAYENNFWGLFHEEDQLMFALEKFMFSLK
jgi:hypothetical protein